MGTFDIRLGWSVRNTSDRRPGLRLASDMTAVLWDGALNWSDLMLSPSR